MQCLSHFENLARSLQAEAENSGRYTEFEKTMAHKDRAYQELANKYSALSKSVQEAEIDLNSDKERMDATIVQLQNELRLQKEIQAKLEEHLAARDIANDKLVTLMMRGANMDELVAAKTREIEHLRQEKTALMQQLQKQSVDLMVANGVTDKYMAEHAKLVKSALDQDERCKELEAAARIAEDAKFGMEVECNYREKQNAGTVEKCQNEMTAMTERYKTRAEEIELAILAQASEQFRWLIKKKDQEFFKAKERIQEAAFVRDQYSAMLNERAFNDQLNALCEKTWDYRMAELDEAREQASEQKEQAYKQKSKLEVELMKCKAKYKKALANKLAETESHSADIKDFKVHVGELLSVVRRLYYMGKSLEATMEGKGIVINDAHFRKEQEELDTIYKTLLADDVDAEVDDLGNVKGEIEKEIVVEKEVAEVRVEKEEAIDEEAPAEELEKDEVKEDEQVVHQNFDAPMVCFIPSYRFSPGFDGVWVAKPTPLTALPTLNFDPSSGKEYPTFETPETLLSCVIGFLSALQHAYQYGSSASTYDTWEIWGFQVRLSATTPPGNY